MTNIASCEKDEKNLLPTANAGDDKEIPILTPYQLDGSLSSDEDGDDFTCPVQITMLEIAWTVPIFRYCRELSLHQEILPNCARSMV
jgi:hypothetical protein